MKTKIIILFIIFAVVSCMERYDENEAMTGDYDPVKITSPEACDCEIVNPGDNFNGNTQGVSFANAVNIVFSGGEAQVTNPFEGNGVTISVDGQKVTVNSTLPSTEVNYVLSGVAANGFVKIYSDFRFGLALNGVSIHNPTGAAINIQSGKSVAVTLVDNTFNRLTDGATYQTTSGEDMKATFFSEGQLIFGGNGSLLVDGKYRHAICSDDYIQINSGAFMLNAVTDGFHCNDYFLINGGNAVINAQSDGIDCERGYVTINGGTIKVCNSGQGGKGIKSDGNMNITGGDICLSITGNAYYDAAERDITSPSGIRCRGNMMITGNPTLNINSTGSAGKGISIEGTLTVDGGTIVISTAGARFRQSNSNTSSAKAIKSEGNMTINDGNISIKTARDGAEGLESKATLTINGGRIEIEAYDDAINAEDHIVFNGGYVYCYSSGNDGIDSNGTITITGGVVVTSGIGNPQGGFDCDDKTFIITGGTVIGVGGTTSLPTANVSTQHSVAWGASNFAAGQLVYIKSADGAEVLTFKFPRAYSSMSLLFSSPLLKANTAYTIYKGGNVSGGSEFGGLYTGATSSGGSQTATFNTSSMVTSVGNVRLSPSPPGGGGGPGGPGRPW